MSNPGDSGEITEQTRVPLKLAGSVLAALVSLGVAGLGAHSYWTGNFHDGHPETCASCMAGKQ